MYPNGTWSIIIGVNNFVSRYARAIPVTLQVVQQKKSLFLSVVRAFPMLRLSLFLRMLVGGDLHCFYQNGSDSGCQFAQIKFHAKHSIRNIPPTHEGSYLWNATRTYNVKISLGTHWPKSMGNLLQVKNGIMSKITQ